MQNSTAQLCHTVQDVKHAHNCIGELRLLRSRRASSGVGDWGKERLKSLGSEATAKLSEDFLLGQGILPLDGILDVTIATKRAAKGGVLEVSDVTRLAQVCKRLFGDSRCKTHQILRPQHAYLSLIHI